MMRVLAFLLIGLMAAPLGSQEAQDLDQLVDPYAPPVVPPLKRRDQLQIMVVERSKASSSADMQTDRRSRWEVNIEEIPQFKSRPGGIPTMTASQLTGDPGIDLDARYRRGNTGQTSRSFDLTFTITAEVMEVLPNGALVIEARKRRKVNGETEIIKLSGVVAADKVGPGKMVKSSDIANLDIDYDGEGTTSGQTSPGLLGWLMDKIWIF